MTLANWFPLALICLMGAMSPGPSLALILRNTLQGGRRQGMATALGHGAGVGLYALLTAMGLSLLLTRTPWLFELIRYAGALFLALLGLQALLPQKPKAEATSQHATSRRRGALEGLAGIYRHGPAYAKAGVILMDFVQPGRYTPDLFAPAPAPRPGSDRLMAVMDAINSKQGRGTIRPARLAADQGFSMKRERLSPKFTTAWGELLQVRCD